MTTAEWHVKGIIGDLTSECLVIGTKEECIAITNFMVDESRWDCAWLYPPGSDSGEMATSVPANHCWSIDNLGWMKVNGNGDWVSSECPSMKDKTNETTT